jgi:hypothetical protein
LLEARRLHCSIFDCEGAGNLCGTSTVDDTVVSDKISNNAKGVVERALSLINDLQ